MLTTEGWERDTEAAARTQEARRRGHPVGAAVRRIGSARWRFAAQEIVEIAGSGIASAAVVALLAGATLLLIRALAG